VVVLLALASAALFGIGVALQQRPAAKVPRRHSGRPSLLVRLAVQPVWVLGVVSEIGGFVLQVAALRHGSLVVVQPLITTSLLFTVGLTAGLSHHTISRLEAAALIAVVAGLAAFLVVASPSEHSRGHPGPAAWAMAGGSLAASLLLLFGLSLTGRVRQRAISLGLAAGLGDATMAVLSKSLAEHLSHGLGSLMITWVPYVLVAAGLGVMLLTQSAYQAGHPKVSLPIITVTEPLVSSAVGVGLFGEAVHLGGIRGPVVIAAVVVMAAGLAVLSSSSVPESSEISSSL
jgi:drug/metabolite transporter (DMT)-like permease